MGKVQMYYGKGYNGKGYGLWEMLCDGLRMMG